MLCAKLLSLILLVPAILIAATVVIATDVRYGRNTTGARQAQLMAMRYFAMKPLLWAHRTLFRGGNETRQHW